MTIPFLVQFALIAGTGSLALALLVFQQNPLGPVHRKFAQLSLSLALWNIGYYFMEVTQARSWGVILFLGTFSIPGSAFDFVTAFLKKPLSEWEPGGTGPQVVFGRGAFDRSGPGWGGRSSTKRNWFSF